LVVVVKRAAELPRETLNSYSPTEYAPWETTTRTPLPPVTTLPTAPDTRGAGLELRIMRECQRTTYGLYQRPQRTARPRAARLRRRRGSTRAQGEQRLRRGCLLADHAEQPHLDRGVSIRGPAGRLGVSASADQRLGRSLSSAQPAGSFRDTLSPVPHGSSRPGQAPVACRPDTTWPISGHPPDSSRDRIATPVLMSSLSFDTSAAIRFR
jgi:hypothetical protein